MISKLVHDSLDTDVLIFITASIILVAGSNFWD